MSHLDENHCVANNIRILFFAAIIGVKKSPMVAKLVVVSATLGTFSNCPAILMQVKIHVVLDTCVHLHLQKFSIRHLHLRKTFIFQTTL